MLPDRLESSMGIQEPFAHDAAGVKERLELLSDLQETFVRMLGHPGPVKTERHFESLTHRVIELLELTDVAGSIHPNERPLRPLLERSPQIEAEWDLDTGTLSLQLAEVRLFLPILPLPLDGDEPSVDGLVVRVDFSFDPVSVPNGDYATVLVHSLVEGEPGPYATSNWALLPVLRAGLTDHLADALTTALLLSRSGDTWGSSQASQPPSELPADRDAEAGRTIDELVTQYEALDRALLRRMTATRRPEGSRDGDGEVEASRGLLLDSITQAQVRVRQTLPAGVLTPVQLEYQASTGQDLGSSNLDFVSHRLAVALEGDRRGQGVLTVDEWQCIAARRVFLPNICDLWDDHIESAIRHAHAVVPALRRTPHAERDYPTPYVDPPVGEQVARHRSGKTPGAPAPLPPEDVPF